MAHFETNHADLLALLHAGLFETPMWHGFLERLKDLSRADHCAIYFRRGDAPPTDATALSAGSPRPAPMLDLYNRLIHRLDPVPYDTLRPGRVYALSEFLLSGNSQHDDYRAKYMIPSGMNFKRIMRVTGGKDYNAWITIWASKRDFSAATDALLAGIAPHISIALRTFEFIESNTIRARIADNAVRRLNFGWLILDATRRIIDIDPEAARLLDAVQGSRAARGEPLQLPVAQTQKSLSDALRRFSANADARPLTIKLHSDPDLDMLLLPMHDKALSGARTPVMIAYLHGDSGPRQQRIEQLIALFGLTRSEARLALNLSSGRTIAESAAELDLTIETARNYSKRIYSKTGTRGQVDLVRLVLASVVALA